MLAQFSWSIPRNVEPEFVLLFIIVYNIIFKAMAMLKAVVPCSNMAAMLKADHAHKKTSEKIIPRQKQ
jgi:hypothetical protein